MIESMITALIVGLAGSMHCIGMCGPLAVVVGTSSSGTASRLGKLTVFTLGKAVTYLVLGVAAGAIGTAFNTTALGKNGFAILSIVAGVLMLGMGAQMLWTKLRSSSDKKGGAVVTLLTKVLQSKNVATPVLAGMLTGLLPCGLVYGVLPLSLKTGSISGGGLVMLAFGIGTMPSLIVTGTLSGMLSTRVRKWGEIIAAVSILFMGGMSIFRGIKFLMMAAETAHCCAH